MSKPQRMTISLGTDRAEKVYRSATKVAVIEVKYGYHMINEKMAYEITIDYNGSDKPKLTIEERP